MSRLSSVLLKVLLVIVAIPALALTVIFACWTLIPDEAPDPIVQSLLSPRPMPPAADNLFFAVMGFTASADLDANRVGVAMVDAFNAWRAKASSASPERPAFDDSALLGSAPLKRPGNFKSPCLVETVSCIDAYEKRASEFSAAAVTQRAWLDRYRALRAYPAFTEVIPESVEAPLPQWAPLLYMADLVDAEVVRNMATPATRQQALSELAAEIAFYQRLGLDADLLITRMIAAAAMQRKLKLAAELLGRYPMIVQDHAESVAAIARPLPPAWTQLRKVADGEFRFMAAVQKDASRDIGRHFMSGLDEPQAGLGMLQALHGLNAYREQATLNLMARELRRTGEFYSRPGHEVYAGAAAFKREQGQFNVWSPHVLLFNPIGKIMNQVGTASWEDYSYRLHDVAGQSRLIALQRLAIGNRVASADMPRLLGSDPALFDPSTNAPMQWDGQAREVRFGAMSMRAIAVGPFKAKVPE